MLHLRFAGRPGTHDGLFDFARRILENLDVECEGRTERSRPGVPELERTAHVSRHEYALDRDDVRSILVDDFAYRDENRLETIGKRAIRTFHGAAGHVARLIAYEIENPETRQSGSGVNSEYASFIRHEVVSELLEYFIRNICITVNLLYVVNVIEHFEHLDHGRGFLCVEFRIG